MENKNKNLAFIYRGASVTSNREDMVNILSIWLDVVVLKVLQLITHPHGQEQFCTSPIRVR